MAEAAKENKEVKKAIDELEKISLSPEERQRYEDREWAIMRYNSEVRANYEHGHKAGEEFGEKKRISERQKRRKASCGQKNEGRWINNRYNNEIYRINKRRDRKIIK